MILYSSRYLYTSLDEEKQLLIGRSLKNHRITILVDKNPFFLSFYDLERLIFTMFLKMTRLFHWLSYRGKLLYLSLTLSVQKRFAPATTLSSHQTFSESRSINYTCWLGNELLLHCVELHQFGFSSSCSSDYFCLLPKS